MPIEYHNVESHGPGVRHQSVPGSQKLSQNTILPLQPQGRFSLQAHFAQLLIHIGRCQVLEVAKLVDTYPTVLQLRDRAGRTALHHSADHLLMVPTDAATIAANNASQERSTRIAKILIDRLPDLVEMQDNEGNTPLHLAVINGNQTLTKLLLRSMRPSQINIGDYELHTAVHWATVCGQLDCLALVLDSGAELSTPDIYGAQPLHYATQLLETGFDCANGGANGLSALCRTSRYGSQQLRRQSSAVARRANGLRILHHLLARLNLDVNCTDNEGRTPLLWSASSGNSDALLALVKAGSEISQQDKDGLSALHCASSRGHYKCVEILVMICGADVHQIDSSGCTPLFYATALGHADCVRLLLESGADVDHQDNKGRTAAHCGASKGQLETLKILHQHGANLWLKNVRGDLPLHEAVKSGRKDLVKWLLQMNEKSINEVNLYGRSALHIAAFNNNLEMCRLLLEHGADLNSVMKVRSHYLTPLDAAFQNASDEVANYLQSNGAHPIAQINQHLDQYLQRAGLESDTPSPSASDTINETARRHLDRFVGFDDEQTANSKAREVAARVSSASVDNQQDNRKSKRAFSPLTGIPSKQSYVGMETGAAGTTVDTEFTKLPNLVRNSVSRNGHREQTDDSTMPESRHRASSQQKQQQRAVSSTSSIVESSNGNKQQNGHDRLHNVREFETDLGSVQPGGGKQPVGTHLKQAIITNVYLTTSPQPVYYVKRVPLPLKKSTKKKRRISGTAASSATSKTSRQTDLGTCRHTCHKTAASGAGQSTEEPDGAAGEESSEDFEDVTNVNGAKSGGEVCVVLDAHDTVLSERETTDTRVYISQSLTSKKQTVPNEDKDSSSTTEQEMQSTKGEEEGEEEEEKEGKDTNVEDQDASTEITSRNNSASLMSSIKSGLIESKESVVTSVDSGMNTVKQQLFGEKDTSEPDEVAKDGDNDDEEDEETPVPAEDDQSDSGQIRKHFVDNVQDDDDEQDENETSTADHQPDLPDNEELINEDINDDERDIRGKRSTEDNDEDDDDGRSTLSHLTDKADGESIQSETELVTKAEKETVKESDEALETSDLSKIDEVSADDDEDEMEKTVDEAANDEVDEDEEEKVDQTEVDDKEVDNEKVEEEEEKADQTEVDDGKKVEEVVKEEADDDKEIGKETEIENVEEVVEEEVVTVVDEESGFNLKRFDSDDEHKEENKEEENEELSDEEDKQTIKDEEEEDDDAERKKRSTEEQVVPEKVTEEESLQEEEEQSKTGELPESRKSDNEDDEDEDNQGSSFLDKAKQKVSTGIDSLKRRLRLGDDSDEDEKVTSANGDKETKEPEDETEESEEVVVVVDKPVVARRASVDLVKMVGPSQLEEMTQPPDSGKEKLENIEESGATASETDNIDSDGSESTGQNRRKSSVILVKREEEEEEPKPVEIESPAKEIQSELDIIHKIQSDQLRLAQKLNTLDKVEIVDEPDAKETDSLKTDQKSDNENPTEDQDKQDEQVEEEPEEEPDDDQFGYESDRSYVKCSRTEPAQTATTTSDQVPLLTRKTSRKYAHVRPKVDSYWSYQRPSQGTSKHRLGAGVSTRSLNRASSNKSLHFAHEDYEQIDPTVINQTVEKYLRKYYLERKLFEELYDLKRFQIRTGKSNEPQLVKRLVEKFRKDVKAPGMTDFQGPYSYRAYEMYIYDLLRRLSRSNEKKIAFLTKSISYEDLNASFDKTGAHSSSDEDRYRFWDRDSSSPSPPEHGASRRARHHGTTSAASNGDPLLSYRKSPSGLSVDYKYEYHKSQHYDQTGDNLVDVVRENLYKRTGLGGKKMDEVVISRKLVEKIVDDAAGSDTFADGATDQPHSDNKPDPTQASDSKTSTKNTDPSARKAKSNKTTTTSSKVFDSKAAGAEAEAAAASTAQRKVGSMNAGKATRKRATKPKIDRPLIIAPVPSCSKAALNRPKFKRTKMEIPKSSGKIVIPSELIAKRWQPIKQRELDRKRRLVSDGADSGGQYGTGSDSNDSGNQAKHQDRIWTSPSRLEPNEVLLWYEINKPWRYLRHDQLDRLVTRSGCGDNRPCRHPLYSQTTSTTHTTILHLLDSSPFNHWPSTLQRTYSDSVLNGPS